MTGIDLGIRRDKEELSPGALTATAAADRANYPFGAIEPTSGGSCPTNGSKTGARLAKLPKIVATQLEFVDIAWLVRCAWRVRAR